MATAGTRSITVSLPGKFDHPELTVHGQPRATVTLNALRTLWFNTGTLCNLACESCFMDSSPSNDSLVYLTTKEVAAFVDEAAELSPTLREIGFTGGEPFMNPEFTTMLGDCLARGHDVLVLTNAMRPMMKRQQELSRIHAEHGERLTIRVSLDHYTQLLHEKCRGTRSWRSVLEGLRWLAGGNFRLHVAGRTCWRESEHDLRRGFAGLFSREGIDIDAFDPSVLVLFPEMDEDSDVPEITPQCWDALNVSPDSMMCASSRMVVKHKGASMPVVMPCTLLPFGARHELGPTVESALGPVTLNHPSCSQFCVLGGATCSSR